MSQDIRIEGWELISIVSFDATKAINYCFCFHGKCPSLLPCLNIWSSAGSIVLGICIMFMMLYNIKVGGSRLLCVGLEGYPCLGSDLVLTSWATLCEQSSLHAPDIMDEVSQPPCYSCHNVLYPLKLWTNKLFFPLKFLQSGILSQLKIARKRPGQSSSSRHVIVTSLARESQYGQVQQNRLIQAALAWFSMARA